MTEMNRKYWFSLVMLLLALPLSAQVDKREVRHGNRLFKKGDYKRSEIDYRKALIKDSTSIAATYDLANALYRQGDYEGAGAAFDKARDAASLSPHAADYHFNDGDVALQKKDYAAAVEAFKKSLLLNPSDIEAKENYIYAKLMLQNQQNGESSDSGDNQQDNQQNDDQQQQQNQPQNQDGGQNEQPQSQQEQQISAQQARQMLSAIQAKEKETQDKVEKAKAAKAASRQKEKNW